MANMPDHQTVVPNDGRKKWDWGTHYKDSKANKEIFKEGVYLGLLVLFVPICMFVIYSKCVLNMPQSESARYFPLVKYSFAWLSGLLGGALYVLKWIFRVVGTGYWHEDRRLWHYLTPHISGALAFVFIAIISSPLLYIVDRNAANSLPLVVGLSSLVGLFSDNALAKLRTLSGTIFGKTEVENGKENGKGNGSQARGQEGSIEPREAQEKIDDNPGETEIQE